MALSDKVIIMNGGKIEQVGSPTEIYQYPASHFVADFIGSANFVPARVKSVSSQGTKLESKAGPGMEIGTAVVEMFGQEFTAKCIQGELAAGDTVEVLHLHGPDAGLCSAGGRSGTGDPDLQSQQQESIQSRRYGVSAHSAGKLTRHKEIE